MNKLNVKKLKFFTLILLIVLSLIMAYGYRNYYSSGNIQQVLSQSPYAWAAYILLVAIASTTFFPRTIVLVPAVLLFSFANAVILGFIGILMGSIAVYTLTRYLGGEFVKDYIGRAGGRLKAANDLIKDNSFEVLVLLNFVYFIPSLISYGIAGVTHTRFYKFFIAMSIGSFLNFFSIALFTRGLYFYNSNHIFIALIIFIFCNALPLCFYRRHIKNVWIISFGKKSYEELKEIKREAIIYEKKIVKTKVIPSFKK